MREDLFETIDTAIRTERLYADLNLMREDVMARFGIGRHRLNDLLRAHTDGLSINTIRIEKANELISDHPEMTIADIAREVGFTAPNLREQFKRRYGMTPSLYRKK